MINVVAWWWGHKFSVDYVNVASRSYAKHLQLPHRFVVITDQKPNGLDPQVFYVPMPAQYAHTIRCRRRMQGFAREFAESIGDRILYTDLDHVVVADITTLIDRPDPVIGYRVGHAGVLSGSFLLADAGALDGAWQRFRANPDGYPNSLERNGRASDQAMLNDWFRDHPVPFWTERDGVITYYGAGYERHEHHGVGPNRPVLPAHARIVILGSEDLHVLENGTYEWAREHWQALREAVPA